MSRYISLFLIASMFLLSSCSKNSEHDFQFAIISPVKPKNEQWVKLDGVPKFDKTLHSDGCSGGMSAIYAKLSFLHKKNGKTLAWRKCCEIHDEAYYYGGTKLEKKRADEKLSQCVTQVVGHEFLGKAMHVAVEIGGGPNLPTPYRWGYGEDFRVD